MKLFEFLDIINKEKFPFKLEYQDWSGNVIVTVDTFSKIQEYSFNKDGISELIEYREELTTEDKSKINSIIKGLIDRPKKAWIDAANDLGIEFIHPYSFIGTNGQEYQVTGLLPDFGNGKGVLITDRKTDEEAIIMADLNGDYFSTGLNPRSYDKYERESFIETLSDWGWIGKGKKPEWIIKN